MRGYEESKIPRLFQLMEERNIKATELSNATGITKGSITDWKRGKSVPSGARLIALCNFFNVTAEYLLDTENKEMSLDDIRNLVTTEIVVNTLSKEISLEADKLDDNQKKHLLSYIKFLQKQVEEDITAADEPPASEIRRNYSV